jgi:hypothetical protein
VSRQHGSRPSDRLSRHIQRMAPTEAIDPIAQVRINILRDLVDLTAAAMDDEGVPQVAADRIIDRVIYGGIPHRTDAEHRMEQAMTQLEQAMTQSAQLAGLSTAEALANWRARGGLVP